jgi:hypothetical protein
VLFRAAVGFGAVAIVIVGLVASQVSWLTGEWVGLVAGLLGALGGVISANLVGRHPPQN